VVNRNTWELMIVLLFLCAANCSFAQISPSESDFRTSVITKSIQVLPNDCRSRIEPLMADIIRSMNSSYNGSANNEPCYYYVKSRSGNAPRKIADQFTAARKAILGKSSDAVVSSHLGKLAAYIISTAQPYHTDQAAFESTGNVDFENQLNRLSVPLDAAFDGCRNVGNPSQFAIGLATAGNTLLMEIGRLDITAINKQFYDNVLNALADTWFTLMDGKSNAAQLEMPKVIGNTSYIGNKNSMKFHLPSCRFLPGEKNRVVFASRQEAINKGYVPCKICKP
jgi:hypothetical protein